MTQRLLASERKVDPDKPHWQDFYSNNAKYISKVEITPQRKLCVMHIPHQNKNAPYAFFVHGACARMGQFSSLIKYLSAKFHIIAFDRIGCGYSDKPSEYDEYNGVNIFIDLCTLFKTYIPQTAIHDTHPKEILIIAHSFGCSQIIRLLSKFGNSSNYNFNIKSVILIGPHPFILGSNMPCAMRLLFSLPYCVLDYISPWLSNGFRQRAIHPDSKKVNALETTFGGVNPAFMFAAFYLQIVPCSNIEFRTFCDYGINVMIITGKEDKIVTLSIAKKIETQFKKYQKLQENLVEFVVIDNASHQCMQEKPDTVNDVVDKFWTKCTLTV